MSSLPSLYQEMCYVYEHFNPETHEVVYVGEGTGQRAWMCRGGYANAKYGHRSPEHTEYLNGLMAKGFLPCNWVRIVRRGLSKSEARTIEQELVREKVPRFNRPLGKKLLKLTSKRLKIAIQLRATGLSYKDVAEHLGVSSMTVHRALNGQTKNIGVCQ